jgi:hypothetical protein
MPMVSLAYSMKKIDSNRAAIRAVDVRMASQIAKPKPPAKQSPKGHEMRAK